MTDKKEEKEAEELTEQDLDEASGGFFPVYDGDGYLIVTGTHWCSQYRSSGYYSADAPKRCRTCINVEVNGLYYRCKTVK